MNAEPSPRNLIFAFVLIAIAIAGSALVLLATQPQTVTITIYPPEPTATPLPSETPAPITVYVTGEVLQPGLFTMPPGSRVLDAINAAGGATDVADLERINLAGILRDGDQVHVFAQGESPGEAQAIATSAGGTVIYINTATAEELEALPGVGPALAQEIIAYREANGPFTSMEDLDNVPGIGPTRLEQWADLISFE